MQVPRINLIIMAKADALRHDIQEDVYQAYRAQVHNCIRRGIQMKFTLLEWYAWWRIDNRWERRGRAIGCLVMARFNDQGDYEPNNVYCATVTSNHQDVPSEKRSLAIKGAFARRRLDPSYSHHLATRGDGHPKSRAVITPKGRFGSAALAAEAFCITRQHAARLAKYRMDGWRYEKDDFGRPAVNALPRNEDDK